MCRVVDCRQRTGVGDGMDGSGAGTIAGNRLRKIDGRKIVAKHIPPTCFENARFVTYTDPSTFQARRVYSSRVRFGDGTTLFPANIHRPQQLFAQQSVSVFVSRAVHTVFSFNQSTVSPRRSYNSFPLIHVFVATTSDPFRRAVVQRGVIVITFVVLGNFPALMPTAIVAH